MMGGLIRMFMLALLLQVGATLGGLTALAVAQEAPANSLNPKVEELRRLLNDPDVRAWIEKAPASAPAAAPATRPTPESQLTEWDDALRRHFVEMGAAFRRLPAEISTATARLSAEGRGIGLAILVLAVLVALGYAAERLVGRLLSEKVSQVAGSAGDFASSALTRLVPVLVFAVTSLILLMFVGGGSLFRRFLLVFLVAIILSRAVAALSSMIATLVRYRPPAPPAQNVPGGAITEGTAAASIPTEGDGDTSVSTAEDRDAEASIAGNGVPAEAPLPADTATTVAPSADDIASIPASVEPVAGLPDESAAASIPVSSEPAAGVYEPVAVVAEPEPKTILAEEPSSGFWERRIVVFSAYFLVAWAILGSLRGLGVSEDGVQLLSYLAGIGLVVICVEALWRGPMLAGGERSLSRKWLLTLFLVLLWCAWSVGLTLMMWLGIYVLLLPQVLMIAGRATAAVVERRALSGAAVSRTREILFVRGVRALIVLAAVLWLGYTLRFHPGVLADNDVLGGQLARAVLRSVVILLVADLIWQLAKAYIDGTIAASGVDPAELARRGRVRTLLPIFRNGLAVLIATVAGLMVLSELGVQVGPLIAGAGIFGVAIGFGSQTLVKDIVSGIFYLMDDAFRVGEYIQSGSYKGTVEGFSLRSVRLRHQRGAVFTVPFGELGAVQNMSRDWSIDKFLLRLPFDTDIKVVKKLTKQVGAALLEDPDIAPQILETVKMKGVEQIGDYGMDVSFAMKTLPGNTTSVRRRAYVLLRDTFAANGIEFARPSVNVAGDDNSATAAAALAQKAKMDLEKLPAA